MLLLCSLFVTAPLTHAASLPGLNRATSLLVVSPHPDDESLCCSGVIQQVLHAGGRVSIVWLTAGDGSRLDALTVGHSLFPDPAHMRALGEERMQEARRAAAVLGVPAAQLYFLGYPDRGLQTLLSDHGQAPYRSPFTAVSAVPYAAAVAPGHAYTGTLLEADLTSVVEHVRPTLILAPTSRDAHPDHSAAGTLSQRAAARAAPHAMVLYWIVHGGGGWPTPRGLDRSRDMDPAPRLAGLPVASYPLDRADMQRKLAAIDEYRTQMPLLQAFLLAFVRRSELFAQLTDP